MVTGIGLGSAILTRFMNCRFWCVLARFEKERGRISGTRILDRGQGVDVMRKRVSSMRYCARIGSIFKYYRRLGFSSRGLEELCQYTVSVVACTRGQGFSLLERLPAVPARRLNMVFLRELLTSTLLRLRQRQRTNAASVVWIGHFMPA